jgi:putative transposase
MEGKYSGLEVSDAKRPKALAEENAKLKEGKKQLIEAMLGNAMLKDIASKKLMSAVRREVSGMSFHVRPAATIGC